MKDIVIGLTPAVLLFVVNLVTLRRDGKAREADNTDRQAERTATETARQQELDLRRLEIEQAQSDKQAREEAEAQQQQRERFLRFLRAAQQVKQHWLAQQNGHGTLTPPSPERLAELAAAYEDAVLEAGVPVEREMEKVKEALDDLGASPTPGAIEFVENRLKELRWTIRGDLALFLERRRDGATPG
jgi:hypothetical protein